VGSNSSTNDSSVVISCQPSQTLYGDDEKEDADDRSGEFGFGIVVPGRGEKTGIDSVPVPKHRD
jgi:hypothetical protein